jgi:hypothetical protein
MCKVIYFEISKCNQITSEKINAAKFQLQLSQVCKMIYFIIPNMQRQLHHISEFARTTKAYFQTCNKIYFNSLHHAISFTSYTVGRCGIIRSPKRCKKFTWLHPRHRWDRATTPRIAQLMPINIKKASHKQHRRHNRDSNNSMTANPTPVFLLTWSCNIFCAATNRIKTAYNRVKFGNNR